MCERNRVDLATTYDKDVLRRRSGQDAQFAQRVVKVGHQNNFLGVGVSAGAGGAGQDHVDAARQGVNSIWEGLVGEPTHDYSVGFKQVVGADCGFGKEAQVFWQNPRHGIVAPDGVVFGQDTGDDRKGGSRGRG
jgi:hypothetical protein